MLHGQWIYITLVLLAVVSVINAVTVKLGHSATISCKQNCTTVKWLTNNKEILRFSGGKCTVAPEFEGRTECSEEKIRRGDISLIILSVGYNDRGWYYTMCDGKDHCDQKLDILVLTVVNVSVGAQATLPCFAETDKYSDLSSIYIQWEKDTKLVVKLENGVISYGSGFEQRAMVSTEGYKKGDLSLSINNVRFSDSGLFRCSLKDGAYGYPHTVSLTVEVHRFEHYIKEGDSVSLDLVLPTPVMMHFSQDNRKTAESWMCTKPKEDYFHCKPDYEQRASILNNAVVLSKLSESDSGMYTITDIRTNEVVGVHKLTVIGMTSVITSVVVVSIFVGVLVFVLGALFGVRVQKRREQTTREKNGHFSVEQSECNNMTSKPWTEKTESLHSQPEDQE
ncbi:uncharacterized protein [Hoplias malabaricus]